MSQSPSQSISQSPSASPSPGEPLVTPWRFPQSQASGTDGDGSHHWVNPGYISATDDTYTLMYSLVNTAHEVKFLQGYNYRFDLDIPVGSTILGVEARIRRRASDANRAVDEEVYLHWYGSGITGTNHAATTVDWPTTSDYQYYGSSSDSWGQTLTRTNVCSSTFCLSMRPIGKLASPNSTTGHVDSFEVRIHYYEA